MTLKANLITWRIGEGHRQIQPMLFEYIDVVNFIVFEKEKRHKSIL